MRVLIADDEQTIRTTLRDDLEEKDHDVTTVENGDSALETIQEEDVDCLITDLRMPGIHGMDLLKKVNDEYPEVYVLVITGYGTVESAVEAMKNGAFDYLQKPFLNEEVVLLLERIEEFKDLRETSRKYDELLESRQEFENIVGTGPEMEEVFETISTLSSSETTVLIQGESGTGKELVAEAIHENSPRSDGPLVKFSCAGFPESLIDAELFGHEKGAFTGAVQSHEGRFEQADGGAIFLDDIDDMDLDTQTKFLRVLQEKEIQKLGAEETIPVDIRIITSSKVDLKTLVDEGDFREDLYYRLNVVPIYLPPLRERKEENIPLLVNHFIRKYGNGDQFSVPEETLMALQEYDWPGNVRELENAVQRAIALAGEDGVLKKKHLLPDPSTGKPSGKTDTKPEENMSLEEYLDNARERYVRRILEKTDGNRTEAAEILGVSRKTLWKYVKEFDIDQ